MLLLPQPQLSLVPQPRRSGGPGFKPPEVEALAAQSRVPAPPNDKGETTDENGAPLMRPALPSDHFAKPFANEKAARANNGGALPPDLTVIVDARHGGPRYVYSILTGFQEGANRPKCLSETPGAYYNQYFEAGSAAMSDACKTAQGTMMVPGGLIAMPPPLTPGKVEFAPTAPRTRPSRKPTTSLRSCNGRPTRTWSSARRRASR